MYAFLKHVFTENKSLFHSYEEDFCKNQGVKLKLLLNSLQNGTSSLWENLLFTLCLFRPIL